MASRTISALLLGGVLAACLPGVAFSDTATGRIYVFHKADDVLRYNSPLRIDNVMLKGGVMPGTCVYLDLPAGDYKLHSMSETDVTLTLAAGDTKQVVLEGVTEEIGGGYLDRSTPKLADGLDTSACTAGEKG
jgi:hypothetical protein